MIFRSLVLGKRHTCQEREREEEALPVLVAHCVHAMAAARPAQQFALGLSPAAQVSMQHLSSLGVAS